MTSVAYQMRYKSFKEMTLHFQVFYILVGTVITSPTDSQVVQTTSGAAIGVTTNTAHSFYGIRYAQAPVGDLRWKNPQPVLSPETTINATFNTHIQCHQNFDICQLSTDDELCESIETEDCLILNVFVPGAISLQYTEETLPVMFYIHGGGFKYGSGTSDDIDGGNLANATNSVVVTINYRLGPLGFLTLSEVGKEDIRGNQGLKDQQQALRWVQRNVANFSGDSTRVMIFGNSAGAQSVMLHTISSVSDNLFSCAIQQSNPANLAFIHPDVDGALRISKRLSEALGCDANATSERDCLLNTTAEQITLQTVPIERLTAIEEGSSLYVDETFFPVQDGEEFTDLPLNMIQSGNWNSHKNIIIGVNTEEFVEYQFYYPQKWNEQRFLKMNQDFFGPYYGEIITDKYVELYPPPSGDYRVTYGEEFSHYYMDCLNQKMAKYASLSSKSSVYFYTNSHPKLLDICVQRNGGSKENCEYATHTAEIRYIFRTVSKNEDYHEDDEVVENQFGSYWGNFVHSCNPSSGIVNLGNFTAWPQYSPNGIAGFSGIWNYLNIGAPMSNVRDQYRTEICQFWESINYAFPTHEQSSNATTNVMTIGQSVSETVSLEVSTMPTTGYNSTDFTTSKSISVKLTTSVMWLWTACIYMCATL